MIPERQYPAQQNANTRLQKKVKYPTATALGSVLRIDCNHVITTFQLCIQKDMPFVVAMQDALRSSS